ncbi:MAG: cyclic nucleotide-binding domain-containing protein [Thermodesulfobacteriota bacterium]
MSLSTANGSSQLPSQFQSHLAILRQTPFFRECPMEALKVLAYLATQEVFATGDYLFVQGEDDGRAYVLLEGEAQLVREAPAGVQPVRPVLAGEFLGGLSLLGPQPRVLSLRAETAVTCLVLSRERFSRILAQMPAILPQILKAVVEGIRNWEERLLVDAACDCSRCRQLLGVSLL